MDVGNPSNMERLRDLLPDFAALGRAVEAYSVDDEAIRAQIRKDHARIGRTWCPHTATGFSVYDRLPDARKKGQSWIVEATAHPAKFDAIVEPLIGEAVPVPPALEALLARPARRIRLEPELASLAREIDEWKIIKT